MDISIIKAKETNTTTGIKIGDENAKPIIEFMNLRCPYCRKWFEESLPILTEAVAAGKVQRVIKLFDKEKESLQRGNVMHRFVATIILLKRSQILLKSIKHKINGDI